MASWEDRYWTSRDGLKLHYRDYAGPADRPPVLCLHGLTRNTRDFENLAARLAGEWRVIGVDFRGRGGSEFDTDSARYMPPTYAADVLQLLDELGIPEAVFIGTSLGGIVTMIVAGFAPQRIAGALLNDVGPELDKAGLDRIRGYVGKPLLFESWDDAADRLSAKYADVHPSYRRNEWLRYAKRVAHETPRGIEFDYDMTIAEPFNRMDDEAASAASAWPLFRGLAGKPVVILRGESSDLLSEEVAQRMIEALPDAELVTVHNVGHAPDFDEPESVASVDRLLKRVLDR
ncbi:MAG TPA: alpha/beta hydrolase [Sphingomicrobium sp.]|nr:alpha/beta hydrolase [Sphingomicrobium sp.]